MVVPATNQLTTIHKDPLQQLSYNKPSYLFISQTMTPYRTHHTHSSFIKYNQNIHIRLRTHTFNIHHYLYIGIYAYHSLSMGPIEILTLNLSTSTWRTCMHPCDVLYDICMSMYTLSLLTDKKRLYLQKFAPYFSSVYPIQVEKFSTSIVRFTTDFFTIDDEDFLFNSTLHLQS